MHDGEGKLKLVQIGAFARGVRLVWQMMGHVNVGKLGEQTIVQVQVSGQVVVLGR